LNNISGEFRCNEFTAIMGASGSGKTSLLNILSGFSKHSYTGSIKVNDSPRDMRVFRNFAAYVMQEECLFPLLSVSETMTLAMKFKVGPRLNGNQQKHKIDEILNMLKLENSNTYVEKLSGGEKKRLSIAVELTNDPQLIFLDEPTTGLDSSASTQCLNLLKNIAKNGHTVICTIHQPSALHFKLFDHLYVLADGNCIYQGMTSNLVPFLAENDLNCPESYNPADFLLEIACNEYGSHNEKLIERIENGKNNNYRSQEKSDTSCFELLYDKCSRKQHITFSLSFKEQFWLLLMRNFLFMKRDKTYFILRLIMSFIFGFAISSICYQIGSDASLVLYNFKYVFFTTTCILYVSVFTLMLRCKFDLKRHIFNM
jgi:ABC-type multidrug transport system ATPase subunit